MYSFILSNAGKGTIGVCLSCLIIVFPLVGTWLVSGLTLMFAFHHFREAFRHIEAEPNRSLHVIDAPDGDTGFVMPEGIESPPCDVEAVMADLASKAVLPGRNGR